MLGVIGSWVSGKGCEGWEGMGPAGHLRCCKICHSADGRAPPPPWGPVAVSLDGGRRVRVLRRQEAVGARVAQYGPGIET